MFDFDSFMEGRQGVTVYAIRDFQAFCNWASRHSLTWKNGADPATEACHNDGNIVNESGVRRFVPGRPNVYVFLNGHLSQRTRGYARRNSIETWDFCRIPDDSYIDEDGFEVENF